MDIHVYLDQQLLKVWKGNTLIKAYSVSTALNGAGEIFGSEQTPRGKHYIRAKIGEGEPIGMAFKGRRATGEICCAYTKESAPERDWITSRIFWLCGLELGKNRLGKVDSFRRYIYIHGTPDWEPMGVPKSHGCIRMRNHDVIELFNLVPVYTPVTIFE
ncbi:L,D-transpeptidase family protein [Neisseria sp. Ec49-e6-T10]|uniref:L,D-transpeptidase family protein n=1 Tax=Neisseria sp. Ec49-e6-T10 TaxID=3140744 RepID=UPI003EB83398